MSIGDNKEFGIINKVDGDVTVYFFHETLNTSSNDTATTKYMDTNKTRTEFVLRTDQTIQIVQLGSRVFTDPVTCVINGSITETEMKDRRYTSAFDKIVLRATVDNTNVKLRVRG